MWLISRLLRKYADEKIQERNIELEDENEKLRVWVARLRHDLSLFQSQYRKANHEQIVRDSKK